MLFCRHCSLCPSVSLACGDDDPDGLCEGRGGVAGVRARVHGGVRAPDDERGHDVVRPAVDHDGPHAVAVVGDDLKSDQYMVYSSKLKIDGVLWH